MKRILLLATLLCGALFSSCEKELTSLDGTTWTDGNSTLVFTSTHATYTVASKNGTDFTGTYTYDPPTVTIKTPVTVENGDLRMSNSIGTIKKEIMTIGIQTGGQVCIMDFKKQ